MPHSDDYKRGYAAGYAGCRRPEWPPHKPPQPPVELVAEMMRAGSELRDSVDNTIATFSENDPIAEQLGPLIDAWDEANIRLGEWLRERTRDA